MTDTLTAAKVDAADVATRYLAIWNEREGGKRRALIAALWAADASFRDPIAAGDGLAGIDQVIEGVQNRFPEFRFRQIGAADGFGDYVRLSWGLGPEGAADAPIKGTDFGLVEHGRLKFVAGFFDQLPG